MSLGRYCVWGYALRSISCKTTQRARANGFFHRSLSSLVHRTDGQKNPSPRFLPTSSAGLLRRGRRSEQASHVQHQQFSSRRRQLADPAELTRNVCVAWIRRREGCLSPVSEKNGANRVGTPERCPTIQRSDARCRRFSFVTHSQTSRKLFTG